MQILIADTDDARRAAVQTALDRFGYRSQDAATGKAAWEAICSGQPEIALMALDLPEIDGLELAQRLRVLQHTPACYLIVLAPADDPQGIQAAIVSGADDFLTTPFEDEQLHARIQVAERFILQAAHNAELEARLERTQMALRASARTDSLTGLWNRVQLTDDLELFQGQFQRYGHRYAVAILNLDRFRSYNDTHGQFAGDEVLRLAAQTVAQKLRTGDRAYRYAGDELVVLLPEQTADSARIAAERLRQAIEQLSVPHPANASSAVVTVSVGVAAFPTGDSDASYDMLLGWAERALALAKQRGGNRVALAVDTAPSS